MIEKSLELIARLRDRTSALPVRETGIFGVDPLTTFFGVSRIPENSRTNRACPILNFGTLILHSERPTYHCGEASDHVS